MAKESIPNSGTQGEETTREQRGHELYESRGSEIVWRIDGSFSVPSRSQDDVSYDVDLRIGTTGVCTCPDYRIAADHRNDPDHDCLHKVAARLKKVELLAIAEKEAQERKRVAEQRKDERIKYTPEQAERLIAGLDRMIS